MKWFYAKDGQQTGPVEFSEIERLHAAGQLTADSMIWQEGTPNWVKLSTALSGSPAIPPIPSTPGAPFSPVPAVATTKTNVLAIVSLVLGILGPFCCILLAIGAVVTGHIATGQIKKNPNETGAGLAKAGFILGYIGIVVQIVWLIFYFTTFAARVAEQGVSG